MATEIWMASAEAAPLAQTGGLGEVLRALPNSLQRLGFSVRRFLPGYGFISRKDFRSDGPPIKVPVGDQTLAAHFFSRIEKSGVRTTLVVCDELFGRSGVYGPPGSDYEDNARRFAFFSRAICEYAFKVEQPPAIIHAHDWPVATIPLLVRFAYPWTKPPRTLFSIHNLAYQGQFPSSELKWLSLGKELEAQIFTTNGIEYYGDINFMKAGLLYADRLITVSPTYAKDILTPQLGFGLDGVLRDRANDLVGILNGTDDEIWNPNRDTHIPIAYDKKKYLRAKEAAQKAVRSELGLTSSKHPMISMVGRLAHQKGIDVFLDAAIPLLTLGVDLCILGDGDPDLAQKLRRLHEHLPGRIGVHIGFNERLAHLIVAGSDFVLLPSRHEPCGLTQMYAMEYGAIPIVHATGGFIDTVVDYFEKPSEGTGFVFKPLKPAQLVETVRAALELRDAHPKEWKQLQERAMSQDFSWLESARTYKKLYEGLLPYSSTEKSDVRAPTVGR